MEHGLRRWSPEFSSGEVERRYRIERLPEQARNARMVIAVGSCLFLLFGINDYLLLGLEPEFFTLVGMRILVAIAGFGIIASSAFATARRMDVALVSWTTAILTVGVIGTTFRPAGLPLSTVSFQTALLVAYLVMPLRFGQRVVCGIGSTVAYLTVIAMEYRLHVPQFVMPAIALIITNVGGIAGAFMLGQASRREFAREEQLRAANDTLERAHSELKRANSMALAASEAKSRFLAVASHDLRQPLQALDLYLGAFPTKGLSADAKHALAGARQCARSMDEMFGALLDISRLDSGSVRPEVRAFPVQPVLDKLAVQFTPQARAAGLALRIVPSAAWVSSDPAMVTQILSNFLANAIRYTGMGGILVGCRRVGGMLRMAVYDTGPGIPADKHAGIFDEFVRLDPPRRDQSRGLGLGLATVRRLAMLLDAPIALSSNLGKGSVFALDLCLESSGPTSDASRPEAELSESSDILRGKLIAVLDDDTSILDATSWVLGQWGCKVIVAVSGDELLAQIPGSVGIPDALICDYWLRGEEVAVDFIRALRKKTNATFPILLVTGDTRSERLREMGVSRSVVLHKPVAFEDLRRELERIVA